MKKMFSKAAPIASIRKGVPTFEEATWVENLTVMSVDYAQKADDYFHTLTPKLPVKTPQGRYKVFSRADAFRTEAGPRRPGAEARTRSTAISEQTYATVGNAIKTQLADEDRQAEGSMLDERRKVNEVTRDLLLRRDLDWVAAFFGTSIWATDINSGFTQWNAANATIIADVREWRSLIHSLCAAEANRMAIPSDVFDVVMEDPEIIERIPNVVSTSVEDKAAIRRASIAALEVLFEVEEIKVGKAVRNSAADGLTASQGYIASDAVLLMAVPSEGPALDVPSASYCASWSPFDNVDATVASSGGAAISSWYEDKTKSMWFQGDMHYDFFIPDTSAGAFISNILS